VIEQPTIFDALAAAEARDAGLATVQGHADSSWQQRARDAVAACARTCPYFIVDDAWRFLSASDVPAEPRAMGAVMRWAVAEGLIEPTKEYRLSDRVTAHRNPRRVWHSRAWRRAA
jgi:hypothetical protein